MTIGQILIFAGCLKNQSREILIGAVKVSAEDILKGYCNNRVLPHEIFAEFLIIEDGCAIKEPFLSFNISGVLSVY